MKSAENKKIDLNRVQEIFCVADWYQEIEGFRKSTMELKLAYESARKAYKEAIKAFIFEELYCYDRGLFEQERNDFAWEYIDFYARPADVDEAVEHVEFWVQFLECEADALQADLEAIGA